MGFHRCPGSISLLDFVFSLTSDFELLLMAIHLVTSDGGRGKGRGGSRGGEPAPERGEEVHGAGSQLHSPLGRFRHARSTATQRKDQMSHALMNSSRIIAKS